jgi:hypothetical protein
MLKLPRYHNINETSITKMGGHVKKNHESPNKLNGGNKKNGCDNNGNVS